MPLNLDSDVNSKYLSYSDWWMTRDFSSRYSDSRAGVKERKA